MDHYCCDCRQYDEPHKYDHSVLLESAHSVSRIFYDNLFSYKYTYLMILQIVREGGVSAPVALTSIYTKLLDFEFLKCYTLILGELKFIYSCWTRINDFRWMNYLKKWKICDSLFLIIVLLEMWITIIFHWCFWSRLTHRR